MFLTGKDLWLLWIPAAWPSVSPRQKSTTLVGVGVPSPQTIGQTQGLLLLNPAHKCLSLPQTSFSGPSPSFSASVSPAVEMVLPSCSSKPTSPGPTGPAWRGPWSSRFWQPQTRGGPHPRSGALINYFDISVAFRKTASRIQDQVVLVFFWRC